jgi:sulfane dehydrogenase subunit SoxC
VRNPIIDRRHLLGSAAAFAVPELTTDAKAAAIPKLSRPLDVPTFEQMSSRIHPTFNKDVGRLVDLDRFNQGGAYWNYSTFITDVDEFFVRNTYRTPRPETEPRVDPRFWKLRIHGDAIERPLTLDLNDILKLPSRTLITVMECAGNGRSLFWEQQDMTAEPQKVNGTGWGLGGIGQAEWEYVPIDHILDLVGLKPNARSMLFWSGVDTKEPGTEGDAGRPIPISLVKELRRSIGLAFKMNGKPLRPDHGAPVRALVPGWCGAASTKWLTEIKIASHDFWVPLNSFRHVMIGPDYPVPTPQPTDELRFVTPAQIRGPMVTWLPGKSFITVPLVLEKQPRIPLNYPLKAGQLPRLSSGAQIVRGYAWAPKSGVQRVECRVNGGPWQRTRMIDRQMNRFTWVRFEFDWAPAPGIYAVETRVTDSAGRSQPTAVPYNEGGFNFEAIPKFRIEVVG